MEWASVVAEEVPTRDLCVHYSLKHQRGSGEAAAAFEKFCQDAVTAGVSRILLVTGPKGPRFDAVALLEKMGGKHPAPGKLKLGVAFNACFPTEEARELERLRLVRKLKTRLVDDVWINCGSSKELVGQGALFVRSAAEEAGLPQVALFGSILLPNEAQLQQMRENPWGGVFLSEEYLSSLEGMTRVTQQVLAVYKGLGVEPIIESKVRTDQDLLKLKELLSVEAQAIPGELRLQPTTEGVEDADPPAARRGLQHKLSRAALEAPPPAAQRRRWGGSHRAAAA